MNILEEIIKNKKAELLKAKVERPLSFLLKDLKISKRDFKSSISKNSPDKKPSLIAEIKKASPSEGLIRENFDYIAIAKIYQQYANAISILTDEKFFHGSLNYLKEISDFSKIPLLRKDFIIDEYQIYEARFYGADAILLIVSILEPKEIEKFIRIAKDLKMDCLVEIHEKSEFEKIKNIKNVEIIGINNRNLKTFKIDLNKTIEISDQWSVISKENKREIVFVSESGINSKDDLGKLSQYVDAFLIGTTFMKEKDIESKIKDLFIAKN